MTQVLLIGSSREVSKGGIQLYLSNLCYGLNQLGVHSDVVMREECGFKNIAFLNKIWFVFKFIYFLVTRKYDLILVGHLHYLSVVSKLAIFLRLKIWVWIYGIEAWQYDKKIALALKNVDKVISISEYTTQVFLREYASPPIGYLPPLVNEGKSLMADGLEVRKKLAIQDDKFVILTVGRLSKSEGYKGHREVMKALKNLKNRGIEIKYIIVGKGDDFEALKKECFDLGLESQVHFVGFVEEEQMVNYYHSADCFVMPSRGEGFGIVFIEAIYHGLPVIGGNKDGSMTALDGGRLGLVVDPLSIEAIEGAIEQEWRLRKKQLQSVELEENKEAAVKLFGCDAFEQRLRKLLEEK